MTNNRDNKFEKLEKLNALIDVCIDDEDYNRIWFDTKENDNAKGIITLDGNVESEVKQRFPDDNSYCTHNKDTEWQQALSYDIDSLPVVKVGGEDLKPPDKYWSHLFYAKLLRAKIKQKGSDCYTRRLDDVAAYLERHLPQQSGDDEWKTRLTLIYLMELSAISMDWESLGFAERARRVITNTKRPPRVKKAIEKAPYEFYELWAHFNIGVAYFHRTYYRKAVQEFNQIIWQVKKWEDDRENGNDKKKDEAKECLIFFSDAKDKAYKGRELLLLPAKLYRAEVQLKLQFAFHVLQTLTEHEEKNNGGNYKGWKSEHKKIRAEIIRVQAYQQLGRLDKSWCALEEIYDRLGCGRLGERKDCTIPDYDNINRNFPGLGERFIDILTADHLGWLKREGEDEQSPAFIISHLVKGDETVIQESEDIVGAYINAVSEVFDENGNGGNSYAENLVKIFATYHDLVNYHAYNRSGYFQQLAEYLGWLTAAADFKYSDPAFAHRKDVESARKRIAGIAKKLYDYNYNKDGLLEKEPGLDDEGEKKEEAADSKGKEESECLYCDPEGIDLRKLDTDHYTWFTEDMLKFFNSKSKTVKDVLGEEAIKKDKEDFVKRLLKLEQRDREDLRIHNLELRYEYYGEGELLEKLGEAKKQNIFNYAQKQCWGEPENQAELLNLPICGINENQEDSHLTSDDYRKLMQGWDEYYLRHLQLPSTHENHQKGGFYFMGLQRWNSASPAKGYSVGGGYLLYHLNEKNNEVDMGIAIDPGFDFVRNLFHMGFSLDDIDIVLISHAHLDHIRDFESIIMLLSELKKKVKREKRVHVILSLGAYRRLEHIVEDPGFRYFLEPYIIDVDREINDDYFEEGMTEFKFEPVNGKQHRNSNPIERFRAVLPPGKDTASDLWVKITPTRAYHDDKTNYSDSFGFLIELNEEVKKAHGKENRVDLTVGYTGDTKWVYPDMPDPLERDSNKDRREERKIEDIAKQYEKCDVLLVHLGSLIGKDDNDELSFTQYDQCVKNANKYRCEKLVRENDHPYLIGMLRLLSSYYNCVSKGKPLVLVSEFGEELRGTIRTDFIRRLRGVYRRRLAFLPVDVGLNVQMGKKYGVRSNSRNNRCACKVWCVQCNHFVNIDDAEFKLYGTDHALYCVCKTCHKATPTNVLQDRLRQLYEVGLELRTYENK